MVSIQRDGAGVPIRGWIVITLQMPKLLWEQLTLW